MGKDCLIVIDPQKDFINIEGLYSSRHTGIKQILDAKNNIIRLIELVDWLNILIVCSNYEHNQFDRDLSLCIPGTEGHKLDIAIECGHQLFYKTGHSAISSVELLQYLNTNKPKHVYIAGFLTEYCVKSTAMDFFASGYETILLSDCIGTGDDVQYRRHQMLEDLLECGIKIMHSTQLINLREKE